jgi:uncharacterized protein (TIGR02687 family)
MLKDKIHDYFKRYMQLRVLFFFDEDEEYRDEVEQLDLGDIHKAEYGNNAFSLKWQLVSEWKNDKTFVYVPQAQPASQDDFHNFPLMGLLIANRALQLDDAGSFMEQYGLQRHQKSLVTKYMKELKYAGVQEVCKPILNAGALQETALQRGLVSAFFKFKAIESWSILTAKFMTLCDAEGEKEFQRVVKKIKDLGFEEEVCKHLCQVTGIAIQKLNQEQVRQLARGVLYNTLTQGMELEKSKDAYAQLKVNDSRQITQLNQMLQEVERSNFSKAFTALMLDMGHYIKGAKLVEAYGEDAEFAEYNPEMIWAILSRIQNQITEAPERFIKRMEQISLQSEIPETVRQCMRYMVQVAKVHRYIQANQQYILDRPEEYIQHYTETGFQVDRSYRKAINGYKSLDHADVPESLALESIHSGLNAAYEKHTDQLNREWLRCLSDLSFDYSQINVPKQYDFYNTEVETSDQKVVVIISDALRYEAAQELLSEMHGDTKNTAEMRYMLASIPSKTNVGMSQLLPGKKVFNNGEITADGISTSGTDNRDKIIKETESDSIAIQYSDLEGKSEKVRREIFKNQVVYLYHDVIDATGDKKPSERRTFDAVEDAVNEIKRLVKSLHASMNVAKVLVTADHGFIYNDREIEDKDKEDLKEVELLKDAKGKDLRGNRYFFTKKKTERELSYSFPLKATTSFNADINVNIPLSVNRYKISGGVGHQFAHGGGSLQEVVVPLIESSRQRIEVTKKVKPMLIKTRGGLKVVSNILKVNILQETKVSHLKKECSLRVGLYHNNVLVSNKEEVLLESTSEAPSDRIYRNELVLSADAANESDLKLKIFDADDMLNPLLEEGVQNSTLIQQDFL